MCPSLRIIASQNCSVITHKGNLVPKDLIPKIAYVIMSYPFRVNIAINDNHPTFWLLANIGWTKFKMCIRENLAKIYPLYKTRS